VTKLPAGLVREGQLMHYSHGRDASFRAIPADEPVAERTTTGDGRDTMGYEGSGVWLVLALLGLTLGLAAALYMATREAAQAPVRSRRTR
jgi:hypothetical protein